MSWVGWMLFVLMIVWHVASQYFSHRKRLHLRAYAVLLLLNDTIRDGHKKKLTDLDSGVRCADRIEPS